MFARHLQRLTVPETEAEDRPTSTQVANQGLEPKKSNPIPVAHREESGNPQILLDKMISSQKQGPSSHLQRHASSQK
jgi:hypothetical protein